MVRQACPVCDGLYVNMRNHFLMRHERLNIVYDDTAPGNLVVTYAGQPCDYYEAYTDHDRTHTLWTFRDGSIAKIGSGYEALCITYDQRSERVSYVSYAKIYKRPTADTGEWADRLRIPLVSVMFGRRADMPLIAGLIA